MFLVVDNYDSFVYNLVRDMKELGMDVLVKRNDAITLEEIRELAPEGIVLSPGPGRPGDAGISTAIVQAFGGSIPILGVCLGHQAIAHALGAAVVKGTGPMHGKVSRLFHDGAGLFDGLDQGLAVTRYHSLVVDEDSLPKDLAITARSEDGVIMGLRHRTLPIEGVQFHPEAVLTEGGHGMMENFLLLSRRHRGFLRQGADERWMP